jgi:predicted TIM-barrel fold metal-dependent hydrolase
VIVDSHVHVVSRDTTRYPLRPSGVGSDWYVSDPIDADGLRAEMAAAGVDRAVLVQAFGAYSTDNTYVLDAAAETGFPAVVIVETAAELRRLAAGDGVVAGVRMFAIGDRLRLDDVDLWQSAADLGITVVVATLPEGLPALASMLDRFPGTAVALDHCGFAGIDELLPLSGFANLHLKVTPHVRVPLDALAASFGSKRLVWGSDFPQTHDRPYGDLAAQGRHLASQLPGAAAAFLGDTAQRLWPS